MQAQASQSLPLRPPPPRRGLGTPMAPIAASIPPMLPPLTPAADEPRRPVPTRWPWPGVAPLVVFLGFAHKDRPLDSEAIDRGIDWAAACWTDAVGAPPSHGRDWNELRSLLLGAGAQCDRMEVEQRQRAQTATLALGAAAEVLRKLAQVASDQEERDLLPELVAVATDCELATEVLRG